jgi:hypothetical protein
VRSPSVGTNEKIVFVSAVLFVALYWRIGFLINDNYTIANTLVSVAGGDLFISEIRYGYANTPGISLWNGRLYGRNYGLVFLATPVLWGLRSLSGVVDLPLLFVGLWCVLLLELLVLVGRKLRHEAGFAAIGAVLAVSFFTTNALAATDFTEGALPILSLQLVSIVATGLTGVLTYRIVRGMSCDRVALAFGLAVVLATPVGFWGPLVKRHAIVTASLLFSLYCFQLAQDADGRRRLLYRSASYAVFGLIALVHSGEAIFALLGLIAVDGIVNGRSRPVKSWAVLAVVGFASMIPFFAVNYLASGSPLTPPILGTPYSGVESLSVDVRGFELPPNASETEVPSRGTVAGREAGTSTPPAETDQSGAGVILSSGLGTALHRAGNSLGAVTDFGAIWWAFVDSWYAPGVAEKSVMNRNLSLLESAPILSLVVASVVGRLRSVSGKLRETASEPGGNRAVKLLAIVWITGFTLLYLPDFPTHVMFTTRYLVPVVPLIVVLFADAGVVDDLLEEWRTVVWSYLVVLLLGTQLVIVWLVVGSPVVGEALNLHSAASHAFAVLLGTWLIVRIWTDRDLFAFGRILVGCAAASTTIFLFLSGVEYYTYSTHVLPMVDALTSILDVV